MGIHLKASADGGPSYIHKLDKEVGVSLDKEYYVIIGHLTT